jgi:hypothetical protein
MPSSEPQAGPDRDFPAMLSRRFRIYGYVLGYGCGILLPVSIGLAMALIYHRLEWLALPLPFLALIAATALFRPRAFRVAGDHVAVLRRIGPLRWPLSDIAAVRLPPVWPQSKPISMLATRGMFGTYGWFWNREWGMHRIYMTDADAAIEIERRNGQRIVMTPNDPGGFVTALEIAARHGGVRIGIERRC